jgi:hypothetical protein
MYGDREDDLLVAVEVGAARNGNARDTGEPDDGLPAAVTLRKTEVPWLNYLRDH